MHRVTRIAAAVSGSLMLLAMSACSAASRPDGGYSSPSGSASGGGPSSQVSRVSSTADLDPGATIPVGYQNDRAQSTALTSYLDKNRLPMVGAQVFSNSSGNRQVILNGFVATDFGKQDAAAKARQYLGDPTLPVINRIIVRPEVLASGGSGASSSPAPSAPSSSGSYSDGGLGDVQSYQSQAQQGQSQPSQPSQSAVDPLLILLQVMSLFL